MMKRILSLLILLNLSFFAVAQEKVINDKLAIGLELGFKPGDANRNSRGELLGINLQYERGLSKTFFITGSAGYLLGNGAAGLIPLKGGVKYLFHPNIYATAETGVILHFASVGNMGSLVLSPGMGFRIPVSSKSSIDLGLRYDRWQINKEKQRYMSIRLAYTFVN
jgi:hypothetical protein